MSYRRGLNTVSTTMLRTLSEQEVESWCCFILLIGGTLSSSTFRTLALDSIEFTRTVVFN